MILFTSPDRENATLHTGSDVTWVRLDSGFYSHPKIMAAWADDPPSAVAVFVRALSYAARYETDGFIPKAWISEILPRPNDKRRVLRTLLSTGLFDRAGQDYQIHDYLEYNPSREAIERERQAAADRKRRSRVTA